MQLALPAAPVALRVPVEVQRVLDAAVGTGRHEAMHWGHMHPGGDAATADRDLLAGIAPPPSGATQAADLAASHAAMGLRTPEQTAEAVHLGRSSGYDTWDAALAEIKRLHGPDQARRAAKLLEVARERNGVVTNDAKEHFGRLRPYEADPTITTVVARPENNASYPSGHSSGAYVAATVLGAFLPERAAELRAMADQVAWSRVYGGVHFITDVALGARIGTRIAADVLRRASIAVPELAA
jgi:hypothetical protein